MKVVGEVKEWQYEPERFEFKEIKRGTRFYVPDFRVVYKEGTVVWFEIKGYMDEQSNTKIKRFRKYYPQHKLEVVDKERYFYIKQQVKGFIPNWQG